MIGVFLAEVNKDKMNLMLPKQSKAGSGMSSEEVKIDKFSYFFTLVAHSDPAVYSNG